MYLAEETLTMTVHRKNKDAAVLVGFETQSNEIIQMGFDRVGLQSILVYDFEFCISEIIGKEAMQRFKVCDFPSYKELMETVLVKLENKENYETINIQLPSSIIDMDDDKSFQEAIDMSVYAGTIRQTVNKLRWKKEDFQKLFDKSIGKIIRILEQSCDMEGINTIVMFGRLAECPILQDAIRESFSTKLVVVLTEEQVRSGAVYIGLMS